MSPLFPHTRTESESNTRRVCTGEAQADYHSTACDREDYKEARVPHLGATSDEDIAEGAVC